MSTSPIETLVILGASGDLTSRLLLPGLGSLLASSRGAALHVIGADRGERTDADWRSTVRSSFRSSRSDLSDEVAASATYIQGDVTDPATLQKVLDAASGRTALYFALPPAISEQVCHALRELDLPDGLVLALEKPFGTDRQSAHDLNRLLQHLVPEEQVFRVDHFLGKSTVLNLLGLRFANRIFESMFSSQHVESVEIRIDEELALEDRAGYYDKAGALIDMIQSHLLLVMAIAAMEPPSSIGSEDLRGAMAQLLRATRPWNADGTASRRARYTKGEIDGRELPAYTREEGVDAARRTETLVELTLAVDTWRWAGVPFTLRSGKAIGDARQEIIITFRPVPHLPTGFSAPSRPSRIRIGIKPATMQLDVVTNGGGDPFDLESDELSTSFADGELSAYGEVLSELLDGASALSVRGDVAEECWRIVEPVLDAWHQERVDLDTYAAGSDGPTSWRDPIVTVPDIPRA